MIKVVILCGGIGGAKLVKGFYSNPNVDLTVVVNTGDDSFIHGVHLSPDLDSVIYALANVEGELGWGRRNDTFVAHSIFSDIIGGFDFQMGDLDIGLNLYRTQMLQEGKSLTEVTHNLTKYFGLNNNIYPMSNQPVRTHIETKSNNILEFQEYFVIQKSKPRIKKVFYKGSDTAKPIEQVIIEIRECDKVIIAPSNPVLSISPILSIKEYSESLEAHKDVILVSPFINSKAIKGPSINNFIDTGYEPSTLGLIKYYKNILNRIVVQDGDSQQKTDVECLETNIVMKKINDSKVLANYLIKL